MGLVYEHWRPDTNECFYVGASRDDMDERPYEYVRDNDNYMAVIEFLNIKEMAPVTKIIWDELVYETTGAYEKMRIAYQRALLGDRLTNKALGGFGFNIDWTPEMRARQRETASRINNLPENIEKNRATQKIAQNRPDVVAKKSAAAKIVMNRPDVVEKVSKGVRAHNETLSEEDWAVRGKAISDGHQKTPKEKRSTIAKERQQTIPKEKRRAIAQRRADAKTPEQLSKSAKKSAAKTKIADELARSEGRLTRGQRAGNTIRENYARDLAEGKPTFVEIEQ
jgi:hypothetical protein